MQMREETSELLQNIALLHTTPGGELRIRNNIALCGEDVVKWCKEGILAQEAEITRRGKNWYIRTRGCVLTVNAKSFTIITAHTAGAAGGKECSMADRLDGMSNEELWQLFPIIITAHDPRWNGWYKAEADAIRRMLPEGSITRLSHMGSTAVPGLDAKPIIDIMLETRLRYMEKLCELLAAGGYRCMAKRAGRYDLNKGYTEHGFEEKVFHLHLRRGGDNDELYFRDYLAIHPDAAEAYAGLKRELAVKFEHDRDAYTEGKSAFINKYTALAKRAFGERYTVSEYR